MATYESPVDWTKSYRTRAGSRVRIYDDEGGGDKTVHGAYLAYENVWVPCSWDYLGYYLQVGKPCALDLRNEETKKAAA